MTVTQKRTPLIQGFYSLINAYLPKARKVLVKQNAQKVVFIKVKKIIIT